MVSVLAAVVVMSYNPKSFILHLQPLSKPQESSKNEQFQASSSAFLAILKQSNVAETVLRPLFAERRLFCCGSSSQVACKKGLFHVISAAIFTVAMGTQKCRTSKIH